MENEKTTSFEPSRRLGGISVRHGKRGVRFRLKRTDNAVFPFVASNAALGVEACGSSPDEAVRLAHETLERKFIRLRDADDRFLSRGELRVRKALLERFEEV